MSNLIFIMIGTSNLGLSAFYKQFHMLEDIKVY